ncbi:response regulator [Candidatus Nitrosocosmicus hydrocola]|uniref:response regulator n=1 Tax=Candidatus Nitrosocosmicus hydrocola TaxID=1826872 RepID=UPI0011E5AFC4|nr:response regulator [Candidatus Nitrosocosmicus hydrocola]
MAKSSISIVVVDDEIELANLFKVYFHKAGFDAVSFTDPLMALDFIRNNAKEFTLLLTDLRMPLMSGIELAREIRKTNNKMKIILITAFMTADLIDDENFKNARIDSVVQKPVRFSSLKESIAQVLNQPLKN